VYEMAEWDGPSVDPSLATQMLRSAFEAVGFSQIEAPSGAASGSSVAALTGLGALPVSVYTTAPLVRIGTQREAMSVSSRRDRVDPELAVPRRVARSMWKDHLKSSFTYSKKASRKAESALSGDGSDQTRLYRKYRSGVLPDVAVSAMDIVKPLTVLALQTESIASYMVSSALSRFCDIYRDSVVQMAQRHSLSVSNQGTTDLAIRALGDAIL